MVIQHRGTTFSVIFLHCQLAWLVVGSDGGPVVEMSPLVSMVVRVVVAPPLVVLGIDMVLVDVLAHVDVREDVLQLRVVVEWDGRERVEIVGVNLLRLGHGLHLGALRSLLLPGLIGLVRSEVKSDGDGIEEEVCAPAHAAEGAHRVRSTHICFLSLMCYLLIN